MCLAVPGRVVSVEEPDERSPLRMGEVDFDGVRLRVCLAWVPEAGPGDEVIVHAGFAIQRLRPEQAEATRRALRGEG